MEPREGDPAGRHIRLEYTDYTADLWVPETGPVLPATLRFDFNKRAGRLGIGAWLTQAKIAFDFSNWNVNPGLDHALFSITVPEGAEVEAVTEHRDNNSLVGKPAPAAALDMRGGGTLDLAQHKGKEVVILDFWWSKFSGCSDSIQALKALVEQFSGKGVVYYTVNWGEDDATVAAFLEKNKLDVPVVWDKDKQFSTAYSVQQPPQVVFIGKDGVVKNEYLAFTPLETEVFALALSLLTQE